MTNLSKPLQDRFDHEYLILTGRTVQRQTARDGTEKLLLEFSDGRRVESVLIPSAGHLTACLSTQFGCPVRCAFCATGQGNFAGNLTAGQIVEQLLNLQIIADEADRRISHVVFMGMGEPLLNYDDTVRAVRMINSPHGFHIAARHITISTVGLPHAIRRLAAEGLQCTLAISLHSADPDVRQRLVPIAKTHPLDDLVDAARDYFEQTGREVTIEYTMLDGLNVSPHDARALAKIAQRIRANVNVIAYNAAGDERFAPPPEADVRAFVQQLKKLNVNVHRRASRGSDIEAACGQLNPDIS